MPQSLGRAGGAGHVTEPLTRNAITEQQVGFSISSIDGRERLLVLMNSWSADQSGHFDPTKAGFIDVVTTWLSMSVAPMGWSSSHKSMKRVRAHVVSTHSRCSRNSAW